MAEIVIVGAGLTGLSTAYYLEKQGFFDYIIVEKNDRPGGLLRSESDNGFTFDHTGHWLHCNDQTFLEFLADVIGIQQLLFFVRKAGIFSNNSLTNYPFQINLHGLPLDVATECIEKYVTRPNKQIKQPASFYSWVLKYFGAGFGKHFFFPYNSKILAYDLKKVHPSWTGRFVPSTNLHAIIQGTISSTPLSGIGYNSSFYYPKNGGIETLIKQVTKNISQPVRTHSTVTHIDHSHKKIFFEDGTIEPYKILISTMPLNQLLRCLSSLNGANTPALASKLLCNSVVNINLGFNVPLVKDFHWLYFPEKKFPWYRLGFWNNACPHLAPTNHASLYAEYAYLPDRTKLSAITKKTGQIHAQLLTFLALQPQNIVAKKKLHIDHAYIIYDAWREKNLTNILSQLKQNAIYSTGRYGEWKYSSMQEAVLDGKKAAHYTLDAITHSTQNIYPATTKMQPKPVKEKHIELTSQ